MAGATGGIAGHSRCRPELRGWEWYELQAACHREHLVVKGEVHAFCPTREEVACAEADGTMPNFAKLLPSTFRCWLLRSERACAKRSPQKA